VSFNLRRPDGRDEEYGLIQGRLTSDRQSGALYMAVRPPNAQEVREVLYIDSAVAKFSVPVIAPGGAPSGPGPGRVTRFYSDNGQFCFNVQGDNGGFIVQYDTHGSEDESTWTAVAVFRGTPV
jgi:hypothetical protein